MAFPVFRLVLAFTVAWLSYSGLISNWLQPIPPLKPSPFSYLANFFKPTPIKPKSFGFILTQFILQLKEHSSGIYKETTDKMPSDMVLVHLLQWIRDTSDELRFAWSSSHQSRKILKQSLSSLYVNLPPHSDLFLTAIGTLSLAALLRRSLRRYKTANDVPLSFFGSRRGKLGGLAVSVNDSDNLRFYHQPHLFSLFKPNLARQGKIGIYHLRFCF